ncbi:hypothetical protein PBV87_11115 [Niameybacter massiliensis]|uniref:IraD/Gp25-like domain-containing protein n=1 Tax=Holtiella tumoricola TaxID=3018743 RepID=A0AA42J1C2_9FIRM|nr:hypothetical protein [Holtiella tumoricola]MDA3732031.1 hypothetical protein [Holtiella tumoricola]
MRYTIETLQVSSLDWNAKGDKRILQNIRNLLTTWRYEVAYDRTKGLDPSILYLPKDDAIALYTAEVYRLLETYQPDVEVVSVDLIKIDEEGNIDFKVVVEL